MPNGRHAEDSHFMILDLKTGKYRDLMDCHHLFAFICIDHEGRADHPVQGGDIVRFNPKTDKLERLKQTIDGKAPAADSYFAIPETHCINWDISPDGKTLYALPLADNQLYSYDLTATGDTLPGKSLGAHPGCEHPARKAPTAVRCAWDRRATSGRPCAKPTARLAPVPSRQLSSR